MSCKERCDFPFRATATASDDRPLFVILSSSPSDLYFSTITTLP